MHNGLIERCHKRPDHTSETPPIHAHAYGRTCSLSCGRNWPLSRWIRVRVYPPNPNVVVVQAKATSSLVICSTIPPWSMMTLEVHQAADGFAQRIQAAMAPHTASSFQPRCIYRDIEKERFKSSSDRVAELFGKLAWRVACFSPSNYVTALAPLNSWLLSCGSQASLKLV